MKYLVLITSLFCTWVSIASNSPEQVVGQLWQAISHAPKEKSDLALLKELLHPESIVYGSQLKDDQPSLSAMSGAKFIQALDRVVDSGFYECEVARKIEVYDRFAHVYSVVESRTQQNQVQPSFVGVNSIQLYQVGSKWQILALYYQVEKPGLPISLEGGKSGVCIK